jgi:hypothetical protein
MLKNKDMGYLLTSIIIVILGMIVAVILATNNLAAILVATILSFIIIGIEVFTFFLALDLKSLFPNAPTKHIELASTTEEAMNSPYMVNTLNRDEFDKQTGEI